MYACMHACMHACMYASLKLEFIVLEICDILAQRDQYQYSTTSDLYIYIMGSHTMG